MPQYIVDWSKEPEIKIDKKMCPICKEPTGAESKCYEKSISRPAMFEDSDEDDSDDKIRANTIEIEGCLESILAPQCYFRKYNSFFIHTNYPISQPLALLLGMVEGIERFVLMSPYRAEIVIGEQFDEKSVKQMLVNSYDNFIKEKQNQFNKIESVLNGEINLNELLEQQENTDT
jgi:hypothetical protein